ncbi:Predicted metal-dependent hydrolase, TIM-barrel fold [Desulfuromusa kysingii]|uniref:Predicted metal-dependent hydrolase, TIM-barrel fold n=1 Tax=Desulfuromusa kysingii TaxID=37625 RepID=A0A1H3W7J8_9BACT|nr:amidohydrolase family protein [Desulfuromusa kysingii]SDZ83085.1 Predicted metal-dependent hydrolase, TIM-barrel fold [Desulfuromusa kysingii]
MKTTKDFKLFDSHFHIIDPRFPLVENNGFLPEPFPGTAYAERLKDYDLAGGAIVSGSFQGFDQNYLIAALQQLGPEYVGVTQLPATVADEEILTLNAAGVRGVRFNLKRGGSEGLENLEAFACRLYELAGWHVELYIDSSDLADLYELLISLPSVSIAHLGLSKSGFATLLKLAERGITVKATGFYRVDFNVKQALQQIVSTNPNCLIFGTDLPSTRAIRPYLDDDYLLVIEAVGEKLAAKVFYDNAIAFYKPRQIRGASLPLDLNL